MSVPYLSGKYWWLGIGGVALFTLLIFHALTRPTPAPVKTSTAPTQSAQQKTLQPNVSPRVPAHPVLDLFSPTAEKLSRTQTITRIRSELEQLLVIGILLKQCHYITQEQYEAIYSAANSYAASSKQFPDSAGLTQELQASAQKTYELVYSTTQCDEPSLQSLATQTLEWQSQFTAAK